MGIRRKKGFFSISAVAKMFSVHQQTIRLYEKQGLIAPARSTGNTRLFSEQDINRLEEVIYLTHELGINLAGVEMILKLKKQIQKLQKNMNKVFEDTQHELDKEAEQSKQAIKQHAQRLMSYRQLPLTQNDLEDTQPSGPEQHDQKKSGKGESIDLDSWEVEYED